MTLTLKTYKQPGYDGVSFDADPDMLRDVDEYAEIEREEYNDNNYVQHRWNERLNSPKRHYYPTHPGGSRDQLATTCCTQRRCSMQFLQTFCCYSQY